MLYEKDTYFAQSLDPAWEELREVIQEEIVSRPNHLYPGTIVEHLGDDVLEYVRKRLKDKSITRREIETFARFAAADAIREAQGKAPTSSPKPWLPAEGRTFRTRSQSKEQVRAQSLRDSNTGYAGRRVG